MSAGKKHIEEKQTILFEFGYNGMSNLKKRSGCFSKWSVKWTFVTGRKNKKYTIFGTNNCSKIRTYTVLNPVSKECNFEISGLRYWKTLS